MEALQTLVLVLPLSLTAGINLYATVLVVGLAVRFGWMQNAPESLDVLGSLPVLITAGVMYAIEFIVDKFHFLDNAWDLIHTFIRPPAAILIAVILVYGEGDPTVTVTAALLAGTVCFVSHAAKAGTRAVVNLVSPHENLTNIGLSVAGDAIAIGIAALAMRHPYAASAVAIAILAFIVFVLPGLLRFGWFAFKAVTGRVFAFGRRRTEPDLPPAGHLVLIDCRALEFSAWAKAQKIPWCAGRSGYVCLAGARLAFTYRKWLFLHRSWQVARNRIQAVYFRRSWLSDKVEVHYRDATEAPRVVRFHFTRYRSPLAEELGRRLDARGLPGRPADEAHAARSMVAGA